jgi:S1/P1 nuclease
MKQKSILAAAIMLWPVSAFAWGQEGHSIVAEIAQRHLAREAPAVMSRVQSVLEPGTSLASIASWADAYRDEDPGTFNWHFADVPIGNDRYDAMAECMRTNKGDCIVAELDRLRNDVRCKKGDEQTSTSSATSISRCTPSPMRSAATPSMSSPSCMARVARLIAA